MRHGYDQGRRYGPAALILRPLLFSDSATAFESEVPMEASILPTFGSFTWPKVLCGETECQPIMVVQTRFSKVHGWAACS
jgi:hypothetical protein